MINKDEIAKKLADKVTDYKRFAFILLALSVFTFIGLVIPNEGVTTTQKMLLIVLSMSLIIFAVYFHKKAMKAREQLNEQQ